MGSPMVMSAKRPVTRRRQVVELEKTVGIPAHITQLATTDLAFSRNVATPASDPSPPESKTQT